MKKRAMLAFGIFIAVGLLLIAVTKSPSSNAEASAAQVKFISCPLKPTASYGGMDGWSQIVVGAHLASADLNQAGSMRCMYGFDPPHPKPIFGFIKPCPAGYKCEQTGSGFRLTPIR